MPRKRATGKSRSRSSKTAAKKGKRKSASNASSPAVLVVNMITKTASRPLRSIRLILCKLLLLLLPQIR